MPIHKVKTFATLGLQGFEIQVEADSNRSLPTIEIIGLPDAAIKESKERLRATFRNIGIDLPNRKIILNLAPSDIKKVGTSFDLPMAMSILLLIYDGQIHHQDKLSDFLFFGEIGLDGSLRRVDGLLPSVLSAIQQGYKHFFIPYDNQYELQYIPNITIYPLQNFRQLVDFFIDASDIPTITQSASIDSLYKSPSEHLVDFKDIK